MPAMAKPAKRKVSSGPGSGGRVTPKGGASAAAKSSGSGNPKATSSRTTPSPTSRYTPPVPGEYKVSPRWVPILMFSLLGAGMVMIFCNYLGLVPGGTSNWYLLGGLGLILGGIITATQYH